MGDGPLRDEVRDGWLAMQGIKVIHVPATDVLRSPEHVAETLVQRCKG